MEHLYGKAKDPVQRSHLQIVWLLGEGKRTEEVSEVTGYSLGWVRKIARRSNERGVEGLGDVELLDQPEAIRDLTNYHWWPKTA